MALNLHPGPRTVKETAGRPAEITNPKSQILNKFQSSKFQTPECGFTEYLKLNLFVIWNLEFVWNLGFGIWKLFQGSDSTASKSAE